MHLQNLDPAVRGTNRLLLIQLSHPAKVREIFFTKKTFIIKKLAFVFINGDWILQIGVINIHNSFVTEVGHNGAHSRKEVTACKVSQLWDGMVW